MNKILSTEAAWLAGLFEGEGTIQHSPRFRVAIGQHSRSVDVLERCQEILGCGSLYGPYKTKTGDVCFFSIQKKSEVKKFIMLIYPYLGKRRQEQCDTVLVKLLKGN